MHSPTSNRYRYDFLVISSCTILVLLFVILKTTPITQNLARYFLSVLVIGSGAVSASLACILAYKNYRNESKKFFLFLAISLVCALVLHFAYHISYNILKLDSRSQSLLLSSSINLPWLGYLIFQFLAWTSLLLKSGNKTSLKKFNIYAPIGIVILTILSVFYYVLKMKIWHTQNSVVEFYDATGSIFQISSFIAALLCLAISKNKAIFYISLGYLIAMIADIVLNFDIFSKSYGMGSIFESLWFVKEIVISYGFIIFLRTGTYKASPKDWLSELNSIRTQFAAWILASSLIVLFITLIAFYSFEHSIFF